MASYLVGNDGGISLSNTSSGTSGTNIANFSAWDATFSRDSTIITGFTDTGVRRRLGVADIRGTARGSFDYDKVGPSIDHTNLDGCPIVLYAKSAATVCSWSFSGVVEQIGGSVAKGGASECTVSFANSNGTAPTESWDEA
jgi:hypothetical protein